MSEHGMTDIQYGMPNIIPSSNENRNGDRSRIKECVERDVCPVCAKPAELSGFCTEEHYKIIYNEVNPMLPPVSTLRAEIAFETQQKQLMNAAEKSTAEILASLQKEAQIPSQKKADTEQSTESAV